jgi:hypothetical protein
MRRDLDEVVADPLHRDNVLDERRTDLDPCGDDLFEVRCAKRLSAVRWRAFNRPPAATIRWMLQVPEMTGWAMKDSNLQPTD